MPIGFARIELREEWERMRERFLPRHEEIVPAEGALAEGA